MNAFDTPYTTAGIVSQVKPGYSVIIRYLSPDSENLPTKQLKKFEASVIQAAGLKIGLVWEKGRPTSASYFTASQAESDAAGAIAQLGKLATPKSVGIFFAVDYDASRAELQGAIKAYFEIVHRRLKDAGYLIGVYGSGLACEILKGLGFAHWVWLAESKGWADYEVEKPVADIVQTAEGTVLGLAVDFNLVRNAACLW